MSKLVPGQRHPIRRSITPIVACLLSLCTFVSASANVTGADLPALGNPSIQALPPAQAERTGARALASLRAQNMVVQDPLLTDYVRDIGRRLLAHPSADKQKIEYYVLNRETLNAFALPGGTIGIFTGLIVATDSASELASVMAHETAHVSLDHVARMAAQTSGMVWSNLAIILAGAIAGVATGNSELVPAAMGAGMARMAQQRAGYTRAMEYEADRVGIQMLANGNYDPRGMVTFFKELQRRRQNYDSDAVFTAYLSHPLPTTRIAEAAQRVANLGKVEVHTRAIYPLMRERARVIQSDQLGTLRDRYHTRISNGEAAPGIVYGYALTLIRLDEHKKAIEVIKPFAKAHPDQIPWQLALARAHAGTGDSKRARSLLERAKNRFTDSRAVKLAYASILLRTNQMETMRSYLLSQPKLLGHSTQAQSLLAQGASRQDNLGEARYRRAKAFAMRGAYPKAINQLRAALQTAELDEYNQARLSALRTQLALKCNRTYGTDLCRQAVQRLASTGR